MNPDVKRHNPDHRYIRELVVATGLKQPELAKKLGISPRAIRMYIASPDVATSKEIPYALQYALEMLVHSIKRGG